MKNLSFIFILFLLFGVTQKSVFAQENNLGKEKVNLMIDRSLFIVGEDIQFSAIISNENNQSKTLYLELILPNGSALVSQKHLITSKQSQGKLRIPKDLISGNYYLKSYTKYLRNFGPKSFTYLPIQIVNPTISEFLSGDSSLDPDTLQNPLTTVQLVNGQNENYSTVQIDKEIIQNLDFFSVSIIPAHSFREAKTLSFKESEFKSKYLPETKSLSLSGILVDSITQKALAFKEVTLSIIDQKNFLPILTNAEGKFHFALPEITGNHDLFISTKKEESVQALIFVDIDYDTEPISLPDPEFILTQGERLATIELAKSFQIAQAFTEEKVEHILDTFFIPFYGKAENTLLLDKYISFETLEEYFTELPGIVHIKSSNKQKHFAISSPLRDMSIYSPLVLMDMVAVEDINRILAVSPHGLKQVDIIPKPYVYGNFIYGGIISIRSLHGDFGGISLPKTGLFFNYDFLQPNSQFFDKKDNNRSPDTRNTLYWSGLHKASTQDLEIEFKLESSKQQNYWLIIQGLYSTGEMYRSVQALDVY